MCPVYHSQFVVCFVAIKSCSHHGAAWILASRKLASACSGAPLNACALQCWQLSRTAADGQISTAGAVMKAPGVAIVVNGSWNVLLLLVPVLVVLPELVLAEVAGEVAPDNSRRLLGN
jgi:hypothetical protein